MLASEQGVRAQLEENVREKDEKIIELKVGFFGNIPEIDEVENSVLLLTSSDVIFSVGPAEIV